MTTPRYDIAIVGGGIVGLASALTIQREMSTRVVVLEAVISREGVPTAIRVTRSLDPGLDGEAIAAAREWRFTPGRIGDAPVDVLVTILLDFNVR